VSCVAASLSAIIVSSHNRAFIAIDCGLYNLKQIGNRIFKNTVSKLLEWEFNMDEFVMKLLHEKLI